MQYDNQQQPLEFYDTFSVCSISNRNTQIIPAVSGFDAHTTPLVPLVCQEISDRMPNNRQLSREEFNALLYAAGILKSQSGSLYWYSSELEELMT